MQHISNMPLRQGSALSLCALPIELLAYVFTLCLPAEEYLTPSTQHAPLLLAAVCKPWRTLALGTPQLWTSLSICIDRHVSTESNMAVLPDIVHSWLARSAMCPLSLEISNESGRWDQSGLDAFSRIVEIYAEHLGQWQNLKILLTQPQSYYYPYSLFNSYKGAHYAPLLESLDVDIRSPISAGCYRALNGIANSAPRLQKYHMQCPDNFQVKFQLNPPSARLTHIVINVWDISDALELVRLSPVLVDLRVVNEAGVRYTSGEKANADPQGPVIIHQNMRSLEIKTEHRLRGFLDRIQAPSLEVLKIDLSASNPSVAARWSQSLFISFLSRSACSLTVLHLAGRCLLTQKSHIIKIMELAPALVELSVHNYDGFFVSEELLQQMTLVDSPDRSPLCPKLESIFFIDGWSCYAGSIGGMVRSRWHSSANAQACRVGGEPAQCGRLKSVRIGAPLPYYSCR